MGSCVADPRSEGAYGTVGVCVWCSGTSKIYPVRASNDAGDGKERAGSCAVIGVVSVQGRHGKRTGGGKTAGKVDGGRVADGS